MCDRESYISHWKRLWALHGSNEPRIHIVGAWVTDPPDLVQVTYTIDKMPGVHGLRRLVPEAASDEDLGWFVYLNVWDIIEPHEVATAVEHDGVLWYGNVDPSEDLRIQGERFI